MECLKKIIRFSPVRSAIATKTWFRCSHSDVHSLPVKHVNTMVFATDKKRNDISSMLLSHGFSNGQITHILNSPQAILSLSKKDISDNLLNWFLTFEMNDKLFKTLTSTPELLTLDPEYVNARVKELLTIFTNKDVNKLLVTSPNVFLDDFSEITEKVQYIVHNMGVEQNSIIKSSALQFSYTHIKCRHNFMFRSGYYRIAKKKEKLKTPPLHKIFSRNIETFMKLTKLTEEEYLVFCDYYTDELKEGEEIDEEDDLED